MRIGVPAIAAALAATATIASACVANVAKHPPTVLSAPIDRWSSQARDALVPACGSCHRSDLPSAVPGALAVFDLTRDLWWSTIDPESYDGLLKRVRGTESIAEEDRRAVEELIALLRPSPRTPEP